MNQNSKLTSLRSYQVSHSGWDAFFGFLAGGGFALALLNRSLAVYSLKTIVEPIRSLMLARYVYPTIIICAALGLTV
ncbi:hypothetical protein P154DRAFT_528125 [Amniculicola lignicola CBS 123094]|uniref:Uncharacterized protein n=1 Tax=Amniculicola lignicola CBS 123094 TaxID=1392246 RepID=A0A6A5VW56_9PLEO|nr:hypothetical protein P154DRAFT_528125 [Amniculicola lignicola CBS 123094]